MAKFKARGKIGLGRKGKGDDNPLMTMTIDTKTYWRSVDRTMDVLEMLFSAKVMTKGDMRWVAKRASKYALKIMARRAPQFDPNSSANPWSMYGKTAFQGRSDNPKRWKSIGVHFRYGKGAPVDDGTGKLRKLPVAIYKEGNLERSHKTFAFRKSRYIHIGPKLRTNESHLVHNSKSNADGFYGGWVNYGTKAHNVTVWNVWTQQYMHYMVRGIMPTHYREATIREASSRARRMMAEDFWSRMDDWIKKANKKSKVYVNKEYKQWSRQWKVGV